MEWPGKNGAATDRGHCSNGHLGLRFNEDIDVSLTVQHQRTADDSRRIVYNHHIDIKYHINTSTIISGPHLSLALASSVTVSIPGYQALVLLLQESLKRKSQEQQKHNQTQSELVWTPKDQRSKGVAEVSTNSTQLLVWVPFLMPQQQPSHVHQIWVLKLRMQAYREDIDDTINTFFQEATNLRYSIYYVYTVFEFYTSAFMFKDMKAEFLKFAVSGRFLAADGVAPQSQLVSLTF